MTDDFIEMDTASLQRQFAEINRRLSAIAVNPAVLDCDYYRFKELDPGAVNAYECEFMSQYPWAEFLYFE